MDDHQQPASGSATGSNHDTRWSPLAIVGAALGAAMLVLLAILAITRRWPFRRPPAAAPSS